MNPDSIGLVDHPYDSSVKVMRIDEDAMSEALRVRFEDSHAFLVRGLFDHPTVVIDGRILNEEWFTDDHLSVILAHELAHHILGPMHGSNQEDEIEADWLARFILQDNCAAQSAIDLLDEIFVERYGCKHSEQRQFMLREGKFRSYQQYVQSIG